MQQFSIFKFEILVLVVVSVLLVAANVSAVEFNVIVEKPFNELRLDFLEVEVDNALKVHKVVPLEVRLVPGGEDHVPVNRGLLFDDLQVLLLELDVHVDEGPQVVQKVHEHDRQHEVEGGRFGVQQERNVERLSWPNVPCDEEGEVN